jgi:hypothetical protein
VARLASLVWVDAYRMRQELQGVPVYVVRRGDATAGAVLVKLNTLDGRAQAWQRMTAMDGTRPWAVLAEGAEAEVDAAIARQRARDPDLWVLEVEDRHGRHMLDLPDLA